ncbi:hypothetical protein FISHEDRAFT_31579, partial [Fistulina hepatica ATCC 64428]
SSGRGGLGNIRASSKEPVHITDGPDDFSSTRGRERIPQAAQEVFSTGRGGAGNIRSPSRELNTTTSRGPDAAELNVIREHNELEKHEIHSTGRGGLGNISRSRSRDPAGPPTPSHGPLHSSGRVGNILEDDENESTLADEDERRRVSLANTSETHATDRGGTVNNVRSPPPAIEHSEHKHDQYESHGRGGAGNI